MGTPIFKGDSPLWFQFLLGTLKTATIEEMRARILKVSIPLRYAKNNFLGNHIIRCMEVSIPLRYAKNIEVSYVTNAWEICFNSS